MKGGVDFLAHPVDQYVANITALGYTPLIITLHFGHTFLFGVLLAVCGCTIVLSFHYFQSIGSPQWPSANGQNPTRSDNASRAGPHGVQPPVSRQLSQQNFFSYSVNGFVYLITVSCGERDGSKPRTN